jgi:hypothetical protein
MTLRAAENESHMADSGQTAPKEHVRKRPSNANSSNGNRVAR